MKIYGHAMIMSRANLAIMGLMLGALLVLPLAFFYFPREIKYTGAYLGGANLPEDGVFQGSAGQVQPLVVRNVYLKSYFNEAQINRLGNLIAIVILVLMFVTAELWTLY